MSSLRFVDLPPLFRPGTSHTYPPFKSGRYLEEFVYHYLSDHRAEISTAVVYVPAYWTHLQNHPGFTSNRAKYQMLLDRALGAWPADTRFFTVVQHDDGVGLRLPADRCTVYGCCTGDVPLPLIYEDTHRRLEESPRVPKTTMASFVGTVSTHPVRRQMMDALQDTAGIEWVVREVWSPHVGEIQADQFVEVTARSRFCLAPRGYGRSSFRFFEAMQMDTVPVYVWDDVEWLPYRGEIDYSAFALSVNVRDVGELPARMAAIGEAEYESMVAAMRRVARYFTLEGMCEWLVDQVSRQGGQCF